MKRTDRSIALLIAWACLASLPLAIAETAARPPVAKRVEHVETRHGETVVDEYFWLREKTNPDVLGYLAAENTYTEAMTRELKPFEDTLYQEMLGRIKQSDLSVPVRRGSYFYYSRTDEGRQYPIQCRKKGSLDAAEEVILDLNELAKGHDFFALGGFTVSDDENLLAYTTDTNGYRQYVLHVKDLRHRRTTRRHGRARHLARMDRRQQDSLLHDRRRRHQTL